MREILFKAKRVDNGEWVYGCVWINRTLLRQTAHITDEKGDIHDVILETICQYTGLQDKENVKIFEGDTIKAITEYPEFNREDWRLEEKSEILYTVKFGEYKQDGSGGEYYGTTCLGFYLEVNEEYKDYVDSYKKTTSILEIGNFEVICNIHDKEN